MPSLVSVYLILLVEMFTGLQVIGYCTSSGVFSIVIFPMEMSSLAATGTLKQKESEVY